MHIIGEKSKEQVGIERKEKLQAMFTEANTLMEGFKDAPDINYKLICLWVAITSHHIVVLFPALKSILKGIVIGIVDADMETDKDYKNGILFKQNESPNGGTDPKPDLKE